MAGVKTLQLMDTLASYMEASFRLHLHGNSDFTAVAIPNHLSETLASDCHNIAGMLAGAFRSPGKSLAPNWTLTNGCYSTS